MSDFEIAKAQFEAWSIDVEKAIRDVSKISISVHCWQGDDVVGFEGTTSLSGGGIQATGNYPGRARTPDELRSDLEFSYRNIPGNHRLNLHAMYLDSDANPDRDEIEFSHFSSWADWAQTQKIGIDFNPTFFSHEKADDNLTLSHPEPGIRDFWVEHGKRTREIAAEFGKKQGSPCYNNIWVPDGYKDNPINRITARKRLKESLDAVIDHKFERTHLLDSVESKLFGIGVEACTIGSHEFYMGYAHENNIVLCIDTGHFHPSENVSDKLSSLALSLENLLLHVSRPMRWDSDHVILQNDDIFAIAHELVASNMLDKTAIGLDFFDATISRTAAWVIGTRNMQKALLRAFLTPFNILNKVEIDLDFSKRFMITEEIKDLPYGLIWNEFCLRNDVPTGQNLISVLDSYQQSVSDR
jgi:L-rhamnose isomerase